MPIEKLRPSFSIDEERIKELKIIVPEAFADGKINWEVLQEAFGEHLEEESGEVEHFGLFWPGKKEARRNATIPSKGTLAPVYGEGLKVDGTPDTDGMNDSNNIFIEGENLEVLKILQKSYAGSIKMIYIDPPYNTGNDFIYDDNFTEPLQEYLRRTGQTDHEGKPLTTNKRDDGRFHSKWLSMMYPRLKLARNLLKEDGIIFISIDDNELHNLVYLMNEIFGEENKEGLISWRRRHNQPNDKTKVIGKVAEYILVYSKNSEELVTKGTFYGIPLSDKRIKDYKNPDNDPKGRWTSNPWKAAKGRGGSKYSIKTPEGTTYNEVWYGNLESFSELEKNGKIHWTDGGKGFPRVKIYLNEALEAGQCAVNFFPHESFGSNQEGSSELSKLFNGKMVFDNPKPTKLLNALVNIAVDDNSIILDFFAGTGSLGHTVLKNETIQSKGIKFILIQLPELITNETEAGKNAISLGLNKISDLAKERLKRVILENQITQAKNGGFKCLKLVDSAFKETGSYQGNNIEELEIHFESFNHKVLSDEKKNHLLIEILLIEGFSLNSKIELLKPTKKNSIFLISDEFSSNRIILCLDEVIDEQLINELKFDNSEVFICMDSAIQDKHKIRLADKGLIKTF